MTAALQIPAESQFRGQIERLRKQKIAFDHHSADPVPRNPGAEFFRVLQRSGLKPIFVDNFDACRNEFGNRLFGERRKQ